MTNILDNFWVIEGLDGSGTTTQLELIDKELTRIGIPHYITNEPTDNETGRFLRRVLKGEIQLNQSTIAHLFAADRDDHIFNSEYGIIKHLEKGEIVISDRYLFSSLAYQSINYDFDKIKNLNSYFPYPEYLIFIDTPVEECIRRIENRGFEKEIFEKAELQRKVKNGYERCFQTIPEGCNLIKLDGTLEKEIILQNILNKTLKDIK